MWRLALYHGRFYWEEFEVRLSCLARRGLHFGIVLAFCLAGAATACAALITPGRMDPEFVFDNWQTADGLPQNSATTIQQTPDGYLWFGTFNGLVRYDGG